MTVAKAFSVSLLGLAGTIIEIEAEISSNLPSFVLVGLPDTSLTEAKDRVRAAAHNSGLELPGRRVTVNLSPASVPKRGSGFDLAIAMAILAADERVRPASVAEWIHLGELGLDGVLRGIDGVLASVLASKRAGWSKVIVPVANLVEAQMVSEVTVLGANSLAEVARFHGAHLVGEPLQSEPVTPEIAEQPFTGALDLGDVIGQDDAVEALTVAAAGGHHMLMVGPPGAGKTMLAERLPTILPELTGDESIETTAVRSIAGLRPVMGPAGLSRLRPFETPHQSATLASVIGGGAKFPRPGLVSLANQGVLFLDEAPEFQRTVLDALRQPLESGEIFIHRSSGVARFPARFQLVMAANPCPCGNFSGKSRACICSSSARVAYLAKLSGPLLDRIDIRLHLQAPNPAQVALASVGAKQVGRSSLEIRERVTVARERASRRLRGTPWLLNSQIPGSYLRKSLQIDQAARSQLDLALERGTVSMRGYDRCLRLAWTNADLSGRDRVSAEDVAKAVIFRGGDGAVAW